MPIPRWLRYVWSVPNTGLGLVFVLDALLSRTHVSLVDGVIEVQGGVCWRTLRRLIPVPGHALAVTLGHIVVGHSRECLEVTRAHERIHVRQYEQWGPLFLPAYLAASVWALMRGRHPYCDNWFEHAARWQSERPSSLGPPG